MVWEQEMYDSVDLVKSRSFLLTFEGQDGMVAFNFATDDEANTFYNVARNTMANRNRRREGEF
jgi:neural Wiskott-Aldrich syndrome protein